MAFDIVGKHAVITGGGGGIGGAVAADMAQLGAEVTVMDQDRDSAQGVVDKITVEGGRAHPTVLDVSSVEQVQAAFDGLDRPCDILVNTAGVIDYTSVLEQDEDNFERLLNVNLRGTFFCLQKAATQMVDRDGGAIVNLASTASFVAGRLPATAYGMTKAGVRQLTTAASTELAPQGVRVNAVAPATIETPFVQGTLETPEQREAAAAKSPLGRIGQPADIAAATVFLASPLASFITGHTLVVDGGRLARTG